MQRFLDYLVVFLIAMFKFIFGPIGGALRNFTFLETCAITVAGMMTSVFLFSYFGISLRNWYFRNFRKKRQVFTKRSRRLVKIWRKYGIFGVAFLTPIFFSPVGGTLIAVSFGEKKQTIFIYMFLSATFWALVFSYLTIEIGLSSVSEIKEYVFEHLDS